jgi:diguanylate cyclase (GGDEF)-like protein
MKRFISAMVIVLGWAAAAWAAPPGTLTTLRAIHALSNAEAAKTFPVSFEATVTYFRPTKHFNNLWVQDDGVAIYVSSSAEFKLAPGDRVLVRGTTSPSFHPIVRSEDITVLAHGVPPKPLQASFDDLIRVRYDAMLVSVRGVVHTADSLGGTGDQTGLQILTDGGTIEADVDSYSPDAIKDLLDAEVEIAGVASGRFDGKMQQTGILLHVTSFADVKILKRAGASPWSLPVTPPSEILTNYHVNDLSRRLRVQGTITYYRPGSAIVLQSGAKSLWVQTRTHSDLRVGDVVDATGFPNARDGFLTLTGGEVQDSHLRAPIAPQPATASQLSSSHNIFDLVSIEGQIVAEVRGATQDEFVLASDGLLFSATIRHAFIHVSDPASLPPLKRIAPGSKVRVTGICTLDESDPFSGPVSFNILLRSYDDIAVVGNPSPLNVRNLMIFIGLLLAVVFVIGIRGWTLERKVRRHTAALAALEHRRGRILENINGSLPLAEIIEEITEMVSFMLKGAPCWCEITDGARLGNYPSKLTALRIVKEDIPARSGPSLGAIFTAFDLVTIPSATESEALSMATGLATLSIETRRLYSDLLHRSEYDLLTDIHNRFSLEKLLDTQIDEARLKATIFGLIYIDLDNFKLVNDSYGHQAGDQYLQWVALRLKRQLRPLDKLARLGGDEFAALLPMVRNRAEVEEIAQRLERSFDEPFAIEGQVLHGSASVGIALYPEDGATRDDLLNAADAAMYEVKNTKRQIEQMLDGQQNPEPAPKNRS